jgi:putative sugar O-methyltransferase
MSCTIDEGIFVFGNWKLPELKDFSYDLFWNSASFQEMEPDVVLNYLSYVNRQTKKYVFLNEMMKCTKVAAARGVSMGFCGRQR